LDFTELQTSVMPPNVQPVERTCHGAMVPM
jgi:hypothetical protein